MIFYVSKDLQKKLRPKSDLSIWGNIDDLLCMSEKTPVTKSDLRKTEKNW